MIADIIKRKEDIFEEIEEAGIPKENLAAVYLYGSHYWGYDTKESDVDLYILVKEEQDKCSDIGKVSLQYQATLEQIQKAVSMGSWPSFYTINYASYLLFGEDVNLPEYKKETFKNYIERRREQEIFKQMKDRPRRWCYQELIKRIFFLNYFYNSVSTFKFTDFWLCDQLEDDEKVFLEDQYVKIFKHDEEIDEDRDQIISMTKSLDKELMSKL